MKSTPSLPSASSALSPHGGKVAFKSAKGWDDDDDSDDDSESEHDSVDDDIDTDQGEDEDDEEEDEEAEDEEEDEEEEEEEDDDEEFTANQMQTRGRDRPVRASTASLKRRHAASAVDTHTSASHHHQHQPQQPRGCGNCSIRRGARKHVLLGRSDIHGWGCFLAEPALKGELISEYHGEVITELEGNLRGKVYDLLNRSYLFDTNAEEMIDSSRVGNAVKFTNHDGKVR